MNLLNYKTFLNKKNLSYLSVFFCFFLVEFYTPFHSDDFGYSKMGLGVSVHLNHYLSWSGRVVSDYCSAFLLQFNHILVSFFIAFFATSTCVLLNAIPDRILSTEFSLSKFLFISFLYWLAHPDIGEGVFWVVGACNYLVTTAFVLFFLYFFVLYRNSKNYFVLIILFAVSLLAGCSNENTSLSVVFLFTLLLLLFRFRNDVLNKKQIFFLYLGLFIGVSILLFAPGNFARLSDPIYENWSNVPLYEKIFIHLVRSRKILNLVFWVLITCYIILFIKRKSLTSSYAVKLSLIFFLTSFFAYSVLFVSPSMPRRAFSSVFVFQLLALSSIISFLPSNKFLNLGKSLVFFVCCVLFCFSFIFLLTSYSITKKQEYLRNSHIIYEKTVHGSDVSVTIPSYYFVKLLRNRDNFDLFHSESMASYFNVKEIAVNNVDCDYSIILDINNKIKNSSDNSLGNVSVYYTPKSFLRNKSQLIIESDKIVPNDLKIRFVSNGDISSTFVKPNHFFRLKDKYYASVTGNFTDISSVVLE